MTDKTLRTSLILLAAVSIIFTVAFAEDNSKEEKPGPKVAGLNLVSPRESIPALDGPPVPPLEARQNRPIPQPVAGVPQMNPAQQEVVKKLAESRKKVEQLAKERDELLAKQAPEKAVQEKTAAIEQERQAAMAMFQKVFPVGMPRGAMSRPSDLTRLPAPDQAEVKTLIEKRKNMVAQGASYQDVQALTEEIHKILYGPKQASAPPAVQPVSPVLAPEAQAPVSETAEKKP